MKIHLIEKDNGESYEDYHTEIAAAFTGYRRATESLLGDGYKLYPQRNFITGELELGFVLETVEGELTPDEIEEIRKEDQSNGLYDEDYNFGYEMEYHAKIIEIELQE